MNRLESILKKMAELDKNKVVDLKKIAKCLGLKQNHPKAVLVSLIRNRAFDGLVENMPKLDVPTGSMMMYTAAIVGNTLYIGYDNGMVNLVKNPRQMKDVYELKIGDQAVSTTVNTSTYILLAPYDIEDGEYLVGNAESPTLRKDINSLHLPSAPNSVLQVNNRFYVAWSGGMFDVYDLSAGPLYETRPLLSYDMQGLFGDSYYIELVLEYPKIDVPISPFVAGGVYVCIRSLDDPEDEHVGIYRYKNNKFRLILKGAYVMSFMKDGSFSYISGGFNNRRLSAKFPLGRDVFIQLGEVRNLFPFPGISYTKTGFIISDSQNDINTYVENINDKITTVDVKSKDINIIGLGDGKGMLLKYKDVVYSLSNFKKLFFFDMLDDVEITEYKK